MRSYRYYGPDWFWCGLCILHVVISIGTGIAEGWQAGLHYFWWIPAMFLLYIAGGLVILAVGLLVFFIYNMVRYGLYAGAVRAWGLLKRIFQKKP